MITNETFDTGRKRYYSNTGYWIKTQDNVEYIDMAILDTVKDQYTLTETEKKITHPTNGLSLQITTPTENYPLTLDHPNTTQQSTLVTYGDGTNETLTPTDTITHTYTQTETYYITIDTTSITGGFLDNCNELKSITFGTNLNNIGEYAIANTSELTSIRFESTTPPFVDMGAFENVTGATVTVPKDCLETYLVQPNMPDPEENTYQEAEEEEEEE